MTEIKLTKQDIEKGIRNEERNEAMNYMNEAHKATNEASRKGYDAVKWHDYKNPEECDCAECKEAKLDIGVDWKIPPFSFNEVKEIMEAQDEKN